jgi:two-component system response regulator PilR (NtrC family)
MSKAVALVLDDEPDIRELLAITLRRMDIDVRAAETLEQAKTLLRRDSFDLCLTDIKLPDGDGLELVEYIQHHHPSLPVAVITAHGSMGAAIRALKSGAFDFVSKPLDLHTLRKMVATALKLEVHAESDRRSRHILLGDSEAMRAIRYTITKLARNQAPIFISGESGTGKELVARLIHAKGPRAEKPFIAVNCGAIPHELMESEFFGHRKGSFTGAVADATGLFQAAEGGTLFLDEVADLPFPLQVKLLRAIQEKSVRPVGGQRELPVDVRIVSASHKNLADMVQRGEFRQDLFYRINVIELPVPPLRERIEDIPELVEHILGKLAQDQHNIPGITAAAVATLQGYSFPGNVRELENILERAVALCEGRRIEAADINVPEEGKRWVSAGSSVATDTPLENYMDAVERQAIMNALQKTRWNKTKAAKQLGITFRALRYRLKKLGLE